MEYKLRTYQKQASNAAVLALNKGSKNGLLILPTGSGKSLIIADIASRLDSPLLVFCPSKEILEQNYNKMLSFGVYDVGIYSASLNSKMIRKITLATIGSVIGNLLDFRLFKYVLIDEAHGVNAHGGMYERFINDRADRCVVGLTATPYRLSRYIDGRSCLKFLTRTRPRIFKEVLYYCQISELVSQGYLAKLDYYDVSDRISFNINNVKSNTTGADYDNESLETEIARSDFAKDLLNWTMRVLRPNDGSKRSGVLVFTKFVKESKSLVISLNSRGITAEVISGETSKAERERIINSFRAGEIQVVANAGVLTTGFDYPELDTVIMARPTKSLSLYYQIVGRVIRPYEGKKGWFIDMCGSYKRFGKVEDLKIECPTGTGRWVITSKGKQLTNIPF